MRRLLSDLWRFIAYTLMRFLDDRCAQIAASVTYTALLALVPLTALVFSLIASIPGLQPLRDTIKEFLFGNFLPEAVLIAEDWFDHFTENAGRTGVLGFVGLLVTSVILFSTIQDAFNQIWRVRERRSLTQRLIVYWALLTLAPPLFGISLMLSSYLFTATGGSFDIARFLPPVFSFAGFTLLYIVMPNQVVRFRHALIGAAVATLLFEALKSGFGFYVSGFASYQAVYGALSAIPILLLWTYFVWLVVLYGAVVAASLPEWRLRGRPSHAGAAPWERLTIAVAMLAELAKSHREAKGLRRHGLLGAVPGAPEDKQEVLHQLEENGYALRTGGRWRLSRDLAAVTLYDVLVSLGLRSFAPDDVRHFGGWGRRLTEVLGRLDEVERDVMQVSLQQVIAGKPGTIPDRPRLVR